MTTGCACRISRAYPSADGRQGLGRWWESRGRANLELLLWAVWDPFGGVPLDYYSWCCDPVVQVLRETSEADAPLAERARRDKQAQLERNAPYQSSVERLARLLADLEERRWPRKAERHAAEKLLDWYRWETSGGIPPYLIPLD